MKKILFITFLTFVGFLFSCKNTNSSESTQQTESISTEESNEDTEIITNEKPETILYAWVDKLRIREQPTTKSEIVVEVKEGTSFTYLNEKTDYKERINLRGTLFNEPWLKIKTDEGKEGWVYGGAVKFYEPVVDANPSLYDPCFELLKDGKDVRATACFDKSRSKQLKKDAKRVRVQDDKITLTLLTGEKLDLSNSVEGEEQYTYQYWEHLKTIGFFLVGQTYGDYGATYNLFNDKSGKATIIEGYPKIAPDSKHFITSNANAKGAATDSATNGIIIYGFPSGRLKSLLEQNWTDMEPHTPVWIDAKTVMITLVPAVTNEVDKTKNIKFVLNEVGQWEMQK